MSQGERKLRSEAIPIIKAMRDLLQPYARQFEVCGSFRRNKATIGDVDLVILPNHLPELLAAMENHIMQGTYERGLNAGGRESWGEKKRLILYRGVKFDLSIADQDNFGYQVWLRTGPREGNEALMTMLKSNLSSVRMTGGYLWHVTYNQKHANYDQRLEYAKLYKLHVPDEETFFKVLGMNYCHPEWRSGAYYDRFLGQAVDAPVGSELKQFYAQIEKPLKQGQLF